MSESNSTTKVSLTTTKIPNGLSPYVIRDLHTLLHSSETTEEIIDDDGKDIPYRIVRSLENATSLHAAQKKQKGIAQQISSVQSVTDSTPPYSRKRRPDENSDNGEDYEEKRQMFVNSVQETLASVTESDALDELAEKRLHLADSEKLERDRLALLQKLDDLYHNNASDEELSATVTQLRDLCKQICCVGEIHSKSLLSPNIVGELVKHNFFGKPVYLEGSESVFDFSVRVQRSVDNLTDEQWKSIVQIVADSESHLNKIRTERERLNKDITSYFSNTTSRFKKLKFRLSDSSGSYSHVVDVVVSIEMLRQNLSEEAAKVGQAMSDIMDVLKPRQQAQFHLEAEFIHQSVLQLKSIWGQLVNQTTVETVCFKSE